jgi:hypothetical protein
MLHEPPYPLLLSPTDQAFFGFLRRAYCPLSESPPTGVVINVPDYRRELSDELHRYREMGVSLNYVAFLQALKTMDPTFPFEGFGFFQEGVATQYTSAHPDLQFWLSFSCPAEKFKYAHLEGISPESQSAIVKGHFLFPCAALVQYFHIHGVFLSRGQATSIGLGRLLTVAPRGRAPWYLFEFPDLFGEQARRQAEAEAKFQQMVDIIKTPPNLAALKPIFDQEDSVGPLALAFEQQPGAPQIAGIPWLPLPTSEANLGDWNVLRMSAIGDHPAESPFAPVLRAFVELEPDFDALKDVACWEIPSDPRPESHRITVPPA